MRTPHSELQSLRADLQLVRLGDAVAWDPLLERLRQLGGFRLTMRYSLDDAGPGGARALTTSGPEALGLRRALGDLLGARAIAYDPRRAPRRQRNRARSLETLVRFGDADTRTMTVYRQLMQSHIGRQLEQVRMLVCEGATVLGWVGGFAPGETTEAQATLLTSLAPAFRERLRFEEMLSRLPLAEATLDAIIDAASGPAALVDAAGRPVVLNALARERLEAAPRTVRHGWREAVHGDTTAYRCTTLDAPGLPRHHLLVAREDRAAAQARLAARTSAWRLSVREQQVLALVVRGRTNEMIARDLDCSVRTVELSVSRLLAVAGVDNRASVVARFWSDQVEVAGRGS